MHKLLIIVNSELFGDEDGAGPDRQIAGPSDPDDFLAMVKDQSEGRRTRNIAAEEARSEDAGQYIVSCTVGGDIHRIRPSWRWGFPPLRAPRRWR
jgi:hypothetical protein